MASHPPCPDSSLLKKLLDGSVAEPEQGDLHTHLETCTDCQQRLEKLAAGNDSWVAAAGHLGDDEPSDNAALRQAMEELHNQVLAMPTQDEAEGSEEISLTFLDPPTKPRQLGKLDHYEIIEVVGRGGMGIVFKALDPALHRIIAVKVMAPQFASIASARQRFLREARAAAAVCHEHVVTIHAVAEAKGLPYLVMQFVAGVSLQDRLERRGPLNLDEVLRIGVQTAQGLAAAHAQGLVHRDIKPANILLENGVERVKITDFGLARAANDARVTQSGVIVGTPQYMAPEQARGEAVDPRADLFSLGSVLYFMCTGQPPFQGDSSLAVLRQVCDDTPPSITEINPNTPDWLVEIIGRLQAKEPDQRFQSATEVAQSLGERYAHLQQSRSNPARAPQLKPESEAVIPSERAADTRRPGPAKQVRSAKPSGKSQLPFLLILSVVAALVMVSCGGLILGMVFLIGVPVNKRAERVDSSNEESAVHEQLHAIANPPKNKKPKPLVSEGENSDPTRREADGLMPSGPSADAVPNIPAPRLAKSKVEVRLSEPFAQVRIGGGGRYFVFHLKHAKKLAIFDVTGVRVVKEIELSTEDVVYACGRDKLMIVLPGQKLIQRWSLRTLAREKTAPILEEQPVLRAVMGSDSRGPLLLWSGGKVSFFDVERMEPRLLEIEGQEIEAGAQWGLELRASADGRTFVAWKPRIGPEHYSAMRLAERKATILHSPDGQSHNEHWALPSADGSLIFRHGSGIYSADMKVVAADGFKDAVLLPADDPRFFLALRQQTKEKDQVTICATADRRPLLTLANLEKLTADRLYTRWGVVGGEARIHYLPSAHILLTLPESNDRIMLRPLNLLAALDAQDQDYLFVLSIPRTHARSGSAYDYPIEVRSKADGVRFKLEAGPEGMTLSSGGRLRWQVPPAQEGRIVSVIVTIRAASGKEIQHSFELTIE